MKIPILVNERVNEYFQRPLSDIKVQVSCVVIPHALESVYSLSLITHNLQIIINCENRNKKKHNKLRAHIDSLRLSDAYMHQ